MSFRSKYNRRVGAVSSPQALSMRICNPTNHYVTDLQSGLEILILDYAGLQIQRNKSQIQRNKSQIQRNKSQIQRDRSRIQRDKYKRQGF